MQRDEDVDFARLRQLFDRIAALDPALRDASIHASCGRDRELERELRALLEAHDRERGHTGETRVRLLAPGVEALSTDVESGERIGPFVLREQLGRGGMGVVYRAERADGEVKQQVAVKVLQRIHLDESGKRRFAQERDIVAQLAHPGIARLFDAGTTRDGFPYYAMELVDGHPITAWCDARSATITERLELFLKACDAVRFAHANLVLHRDIKPANVLVDASGAPKLIDFGIAKPMASLDDTATGLQLFSPSNAAPEQLRGERCGVACDVYQLGTLLYELLTGTTVLGDTTASAAEIEAAILHRVPTRPSEVARDPAMVKLLRGDLDTIVLRALRKEPEQRYPSVEQLADELRRHLRNEPIAARGSDRAYRLRKFVMRNRATIAAGVAIVVLAASVITVQVVQSQRLERERDAATVERNRAQAASRFLRSLFQGANPGKALSRDLTAADILLRGREQIDRELAEQPELRIPLLATIASIHSTMGDQATAVRIADQVEQGLAAGVRIDDRSMVELLVQVAAIRRGAGDLKSAVEHARAALAIQRRLGDSAGARWEARSMMVTELQWRDRSAWQPYLLEMLAELEADAGIDPVLLAHARVEIGHNLEYAEAFELGEHFIRQGMPVLEASLPANDHRVLTAYRALGSMLVAQARSAEALPLLEELLRREVGVYGPDAPMVARTRLRLGNALRVAGRHEEAQESLERAIAVLREIGPFPQGPVMVGLTYLGRLQLVQERYAAAEASFREAVRIADAIGADIGPNGLDTRTGLGEALNAQDREAEAADVLAACESFVSWTVPAHAEWGIAYAEALHGSGRDAQALQLLDKVDAVMEARPAPYGALATRSRALRRTLDPGTRVESASVP